MDEQNKDGAYEPSNPAPPQYYGQQGQYPQAPTPGVIGPQYSPVGAGQNMQAGGPTKKSKTGLIVAIVLGVVLLVGGTVAAVLLLTKEAQTPPPSITLTKSYDSPFGLLSSFQSQDVAKGSFKINAKYVSDGDFSREGSFFVEESVMHLEMLPDAASVNQLLKTMYAKQGTEFVEKDHGATRSFKYDFNSLLGYQYLYDKASTKYGGLVEVVEAAKADAKLAAAYKFVRLDENCASALPEVKSKTGANLSTTSLGFDYEREGVQKTKATVKFENRQALDKAVYTFLESCYDLNNAEVAKYKTVAKGLKDNVTRSPSFLFWNEEGVDHLNITPADKDAAFGGELKFEFNKLNQSEATRSGESAPYNERRNLFGLTNSLCRVPPVVTGAVGSSYAFMIEDTAYHQPAAADSGYYCTTLAVPPQFLAPESMKVKFSGAQISVGAAEVSNQRVLHDVLYKIERFNLDKKRYPGVNEFNDIANNNLEALTAASQGLVSGKLMVYAPSPAECIGNCNDFVLNYVSGANLIHTRKSYKP